MHRLIVGTFRHPHLYSLEFDPQQEQNALRIVGTHEATGGHSWLHLNDSKDTLYCTGWTKPPSLAAYRLSHSGSSVKLELLNQAYPKYLSGYVTANKLALYSASGPQGDVFALNPDTGAFATAGEEDVEPLQSFSFLSEAERQAIERGENIGGIMDFGGLRHGGHVSSSCAGPKSLTDKFTECRLVSGWKSTIHRRHVRHSTTSTVQH